VSWANNYEDAVQQIKLGQQELLLFDYRLGEHSGLELLSAARDLGCKAPIIMLTGQGDYEIDVAAMEAGASDYLIKGQLTVALLERSIRYALQRRRVEELRLAKEAAEQANRARSEFLSRVSHELRTPMNAILGFAQLLELEELSPDQQESIQHILKAGWHMISLINQVIEMADIDAGDRHLSREPMALKGAVNASVASVRARAVARNLSIETDLSAGDDVVVLADRQALRQALVGLLDNAVKYNRDAGSILVHCQVRSAYGTAKGDGVVDSATQDPDTAQSGAGNRRSPDRVRIIVTDSGPGIDPRDFAWLFTPFNRLGAERSGIPGTGLGLAQAQYLAQAMGGAIGVDSTPGEGSSFWIELDVSTVSRWKPDERFLEEPEDESAPPGKVQED
jgi:hypothetical protein